MSLLACGLIGITVSRSPSALAQTTSPRLAWDGSLSGVLGFAVNVDGARTDYHLSPVAGNGTCGCSVAVPFSGGRHTVIVSAYNAYGEAASSPLVVAPIAKPGGPYSAAPGSTLTVNGSGSSHPAGTIVRWTWNWGDGTAATTAMTSTASHRYLSAGTYKITLLVQDNAGATASASTTAVVSSTATSVPDTIVLWSANVPASGLHGNWARVADSSAAGGAALVNADRGAAKIAPALAQPASYFETTFTAPARIPFHVWVRLRAQNDAASNDSIHVQFSDAVDAGGGSMMRIGTNGSAELVLQAGPGGAAPRGWGWADNGWGTLGGNITFASTGVHTIRVQQREDGVVIDQIVLSADIWAATPPGPRRDDRTILTASQTGGASIVTSKTAVLWMADVPVANLHGDWSRAPLSAAAGGFTLWNPNRSLSKVAPALASPTSYFETSVNAAAGGPYHVWVRLAAEGNATANDSVHLQFSDAVTAAGAAAMRIGSASSAEFVLQAGPSGAAPLWWGWADNGWGTRGADIYFATTGAHTIRVQQREDGALIDQIVISGDQYLFTPPGPRRADGTIVPRR